MVRFKHRYFLIELKLNPNESNELLMDLSMSSSIIYNTLKHNIQHNYGIYGGSNVINSLQVKYYNSYTNLFIVRVLRDTQSLFKQSIIYCTTIKQYTGVRMNVLYCSGTIKSVQNFTIKYNRKLLLDTLRSTIESPGNIAPVNDSVQLNDTNILMNTLCNVELDTVETNTADTNKRKSIDIIGNSSIKKSRIDSTILTELQRMEYDINALEP